MKFTWIILIFAFLAAPLIQSCSMDDGYNLPWLDADKIALVTIIPVSDDEEEDEFYFLIDGNKKLYPGKTDRINSIYKWKAGQRAWVYYDELSETVPGYDYNGDIFHIENILTKGVIAMDETTADSIGDDRVNIIGAWFSGDHLNIEFQFMGTPNPKDLHMVNLVRNETQSGITEAGSYIMLEFRHNAYDDYPQETLTGIVSFRPPFTNSEVTKPFEGVRLRVNTIYDGVKYMEIKFQGEDKSRAFSTEGELLK